MLIALTNRGPVQAVLRAAASDWSRAHPWRTANVDFVQSLDEIDTAARRPFLVVDLCSVPQTSRTVIDALILEATGYVKAQILYDIILVADPDRDMETIIRFAQNGVRRVVRDKDCQRLAAWREVFADLGMDATAFELRVALEARLEARRFDPGARELLFRLLYIAPSAPSVAKLQDEQLLRSIGGSKVSTRAVQATLRSLGLPPFKPLLTLLRVVWMSRLRADRWPPGRVAREMHHTDARQAMRSWNKLMGRRGLKDLDQVPVERILAWVATTLTRPGTKDLTCDQLVASLNMEIDESLALVAAQRTTGTL